jgi:hypothetical protein
VASINPLLPCRCTLPAHLGCLRGEDELR